MTHYAAHVSSRQTPQSEPIPGKVMTENSAGGFAFAVDDWKRLERFLILGNDGGTYYVSERKLTQANAQCVARCLAADAERTVRTIVEISESGRAPQNDPAVFALALAAASSTSARGQLHDALPRVCRTGTHLFHFVAAIKELRGIGRGLRTALANWYVSKAPRDLTYQCIKYQQRDGWSHRDVLRLCHAKADTARVQDILHWVVRGWPDTGETPHPEPALLPIWAFEQAKKATTEGEIVRLIRDYRLVRECVPTQWLNSPDVWGALLEEMPLTAILRNLGKMSSVQLLLPLSGACDIVRRRLEDTDAMKRARVHPLAILVALKTYAHGHGERGSNKWTPVQSIVDVLDTAFYASFDAVVPTGKRWLIGVDCSGSMDCGNIAGLASMNPRTVAAALALVTASTENNCLIAGFSDRMQPLSISTRQRLDTVAATMRALSWGRTDCAQPMLYAIENKLNVDAFLIITDNETWCGGTHPSQALKEYRRKSGIPARSIVMAMTATKFSIADPEDAGSLDVVGCDTSTPAVIADFVRD